MVRSIALAADLLVEKIASISPSRVQMTRNSRRRRQVVERNLPCERFWKSFTYWSLSPRSAAHHSRQRAKCGCW